MHVLFHFVRAAPSPFSLFLRRRCPPPPALLQSDAKSAEPEDPLKEDVLYQLQTLFGHLALSSRKFYNPMPWLHAYKDDSGRPTNPLIQQDAQEYFNMFSDRLENRLKGSAQEKLLQARCWHGCLLLLLLEYLLVLLLDACCFCC